MLGNRPYRVRLRLEAGFADAGDVTDNHPARRAAPPLVRRRTPTEAAPVHPGGMLLDQSARPLGVSQPVFAIRLGVGFPRLNAIVRRKRASTPGRALRLAEVTGMRADLRIGLQSDRDRSHALRAANEQQVATPAPRPRAGGASPAPRGVRLTGD